MPNFFKTPWPAVGESRPLGCQQPEAARGPEAAPLYAPAVWKEKMNDSSILKDKRAVVFGAGGSIGAAVARKFGAEGAEVFLAGRTESTLDAVTRQINESGGQASYAVIDALDDSAVDEYLDRVVKQAGRIDIGFNATGPRITEYGNGKPAVDLTVAEFLAAQTVLTSQFITASRAARYMVSQGSGVIIFLTGSPARPHGPGASGIGAAFGGIENLTRTMALELSGTGVRVVCLRTAANPDTRTIQDTAGTVAKMLNLSKEQVLADLDQGTWLKGSPHTEDTANGAVLLASDLARMMTGTVHNATAGVCAD
jgi:3-oxoacyl-[acyl-carrier protein] reductase